jgi:hypothetical protein
MGNGVKRHLNFFGMRPLYLGVWGEGRGSTRDLRWIGVHRDVAGVYMTSMAEAIASNSGYGLLSDDVTGHLVVGERSVERLAEMLLSSPRARTTDTSRHSE